MMTTKVLKKKFLKSLWVVKVLYIGLLISSTDPQVTVEVMKVVDIGIKIPDTLHQLIAEGVVVGQV